jgi:hypothetical protein
MPKYYEAKQVEINDEAPEGIEWNKKINGWQISNVSKPVVMAVLDQEEYFNFVSGDIKTIFPDYDSKKHVVSVDTYEARMNDYANVPISLKEFTDEQIKIPFGSFVFRRDKYGGIFLKKFHISMDKFVEIGNSPIDIYKEYNIFRSETKHRYKEEGRKAKEAILCYGKPGNSKTMEICKLAQHAENDKFRVFFVPNNVDFEDIVEFKNVLENEDNVFVIEEITERSRKPEELLSFLDGEMSWNNCYTIATTNFPEDLALNLLDRPSRFKHIKEFLPPNEQQRTIYLQKTGFPESDILEAVKLTAGMSLDYLINIAFDAKIKRLPIHQVVNEYKEQRKRLTATFKGRMGIE